MYPCRSGLLAEKASAGTDTKVCIGKRIQTENGGQLEGGWRKQSTAVFKNHNFTKGLSTTSTFSSL